MTEMTEVVTPEDVERRLRQLGRELDTAHDLLHACELQYAKAKTDYELAVARQRLAIRDRMLVRGSKITVQEIEDHALLACDQQFTELNIAEASVKAARANNVRVRTQIDIARSVGTSVRASMEVQ